jgi:hypothetical protein
MSAWPARFALGHLATAAVVGIAGGLGALGPWWLPVGGAALLAGVVAGAVWGLAVPDRLELSRLAAGLNRSAWGRIPHPSPTVTSEA